MAEFSPEYVALMVKLALERGSVDGLAIKGWREGDWYVLGDSVEVYCGYDEWTPRQLLAFGLAVWLPLEGDWLRMLEEAGARYIRLFDASRVAADRWPGWRAKAVIHDGSETQEITGAGTNFLEALARLWMAVTGRDA